MAWFAPSAPLFPEILDLHGRWQGDKPALVGRGGTRGWREFVTAIHRIAHGLAADGVGPGDRVAVLMDNSPAMVEVLFGILRANAVAVPLNAMVSTEAADAMLADARAVALFASAAHQDRWHAPPVERCYGEARTGWTELATWCAAQPAQPPAPALEDPDECNIIYSSGTTGLPKGIVHTHRARLDWFYDLGLALRYDAGAVTLMTLGLYSNISWAAMGPTLLCGGTLVIEPGFDAKRFLEVVETQGCTHAAMVPLQYQRILAEPTFASERLTSLRALMCCGSPLDGATKAAVMERFGGAALIELYGLTEGLITTLAPEEAAGRLASVGKPLPGTDVRIIDDDARELPAGEPGEIVGRGRILMAGYNDRDDANEAATWLGPDGRRWLRTGDIGYLDEAGFLYLVDRKKDMILSGGQNVYPADLEAVLLEHEAVAEVAVVGVASPRWGESPLALIVPSAGPESFDGAALVAWANGRVAKYQRLCGAVAVDALPRNPNGKILKRELRETYADFLG